MSAVEARAETSSGPVVLELGPGAGAVVALAPEEWLGWEIEAGSPNDRAGRRHAEVRRRPVGGGEVFAVVLAPLRPGPYRLFAPDGRELTTVEVRSGEVSELRVGT